MAGERGGKKQQKLTSDVKKTKVSFAMPSSSIVPTRPATMSSMESRVPRRAR